MQLFINEITWVGQGIAMVTTFFLKTLKILVRITPPLLFNEISSYLHGWMILMCSCA